MSTLAQRIAFISLMDLAVAVSMAAAQRPRKPPAGRQPPPAPGVVEGSVGKKLDQVLLAVDADDGGFCGVALVAVRGKVLLEKGYGLADAAAQKPMPCDALYDWASVSKQFTAAAVLRLLEASQLGDAQLRKLEHKRLADSLRKWRRLGLDDPLSRFFPEVPKDKERVTLRQLLNHTSGMEAGFKSEWKFDSRDRESFVKLALGLPMVAKPGAKWEYSNSGYALIAAIIERVTKLSFEEFCVEYVFEPAGMTDATMIGHGTLDAASPQNALGRVPRIDRGAGFTDRPAAFHFAYGDRLTWGYRGCGGVVATARDLLAWDRALRGGKFLGPQSLADLYRPGLRDYALGWEVGKAAGGPCVQHSGGVHGVVTHYLRLLDEDVVVALACSYRPKEHPARIADRLARIALGGS